MKAEFEIRPASGQPFIWQASSDEETVGRDPGCDLRIRGDDTDVVSWRHALVEIRAGSAFVTDLNSLNGTFINGKRIAVRTILQKGDEIRLGENGPRIKLLHCQTDGSDAERPEPTKTPPAEQRTNKARKNRANPVAEFWQDHAVWLLPVGVGLVIAACGAMIVGVLLRYSPVVATGGPPAVVSPIADSKSVEPDTLTTAGDAGKASFALAKQAEAVLRRTCYGCHGEQGSDAGGFDFVLDHSALLQDLVVPGDPDNSLLLERIEDGDMPPPDKEPQPSAEETQLLRRWIAAGAPSFEDDQDKAPRAFVDNERVLNAIATDLQGIAARNRVHIRYFTLTHLYNAGESDARLENYRGAMAKLVNSLSWKLEIKNPQPIEETKTILRIDLRDYDWNADVWDAIVTANPYAFRPSSSRMQECATQTASDMPFARGDWFVFAASRPPLYEKVLQLPQTVKALEAKLNVDATQRIQDDRVARAAFVKSGVSQHNRMIERHESQFGYYYKSYDNDASDGRKNFIDHPLGPAEALPASQRDQAFQFAGGEMIFELPNGLQGYYLANASGEYIAEGPTEIVFDRNNEFDPVIRNGISCMTCHYDGIIRARDEVRPAVEALPDAYPDREDILALYPRSSEMKQLQDEDIESFREAMATSGLNTRAREGEPIGNISARFKRELTIDFAAAEAGVQADALQTAIRENQQLSRLLAPLLSGGKVKRDSFQQAFPDVVQMLGLGSPIN